MKPTWRWEGWWTRGTSGYEAPSGKQTAEMRYHVAQLVKNPPANARDTRDVVLIPEWERSLEEELATRSSILAWEIPWAEKPGGLQSMGLQRVRHNRVYAHACTHTHTDTLQQCGVRGSRAPWQLRHQELGSVPPTLESRPMTCSEVEHGRSEVTGDLYLSLSCPVKQLSPWGTRDHVEQSRAFPVEASWPTSL